jgi:hypothetical protein
VYGAIFLSEDQTTALMCDLCGGEPFCIDSCIYGAIKYQGSPDQVYDTLDTGNGTIPGEERRWQIANTLANKVREPQERQP